MLFRTPETTCSTLPILKNAPDIGNKPQNTTLCSHPPYVVLHVYPKPCSPGADAAGTISPDACTSRIVIKAVIPTASANYLCSGLKNKADLLHGVCMGRHLDKREPSREFSEHSRAISYGAHLHDPSVHSTLWAVL